MNLNHAIPPISLVYQQLVTTLGIRKPSEQCRIVMNGKDSKYNEGYNIMSSISKYEFRVHP